MHRKIALVAALAALLPAAMPASAATTRNVSVRDNYFRPGSLTVRKYDTVRWRWAGRAPHNVAVARGPVKFRSSTKTTGTYSRRMTRRGTYRIVCTIHPGMRMTLRVT